MQVFHHIYFFDSSLLSVQSSIFAFVIKSILCLAVFSYYFYFLQTLLSLRSTLLSFSASKLASLKLTYMATEDLSLDHRVASCVQFVSTIKIVLKVRRGPSESDSTLEWTFHVWTTLSVLWWDPLLHATHCLALPIPWHCSAVCQYKMWLRITMRMFHSEVVWLPFGSQKLPLNCSDSAT